MTITYALIQMLEKAQLDCLNTSAQNAMFDSSFCTLEWLDIGG